VLHKIEDAFERLYNSARFKETCKYLHSLYKSPFQMYRDLSEYLEKNKSGDSLDSFTYDIFTYFSSLYYVDRSILRDKLAYDRLSSNKSGYLPELLKIHTPIIKEYLNCLEQNPDTKRHRGIKRAATVLPTENKFIYVDYDDYDPVGKIYAVKKSDLNFK